MTQPVRLLDAAGVSEVAPTVALTPLWAEMATALAVRFTSLLTSFPQLKGSRRARSGRMNNLTPPVPLHSPNITVCFDEISHPALRACLRRSTACREGSTLLANGGAAAGDATGDGVDCRPADHGLGYRGVTFVVPGQPAVCGQPGGWVGRAARYQPGLVLFRAASRRTGLDGFPIIRLSSDYCVSVATGCPVWMWPWQEAQTTRVLRRLFVMALAHRD
jgi:hypothetical protein